MGLDDIVGTAKDMLGSNSEAVDGAIDQAADAVKDKTPDQVDGLVDQGAEALKDQI
ncbi:MAG: antitoxin [Candidatus Nanopelagicales bacterium]